MLIKLQHMKEREQTELTIKPVNPTLSEGVYIFMPELGGGDIPQNPITVDNSEEKPQKPIETVETETTGDISEGQRKARNALRNLSQPGEGASMEERSSYELIRNELMEMAGIASISGGSGEDEQRKITEELRDYIVKSKDGASIGITNNLRRILRENGIDDSQIDYFADHPEEFKESLGKMLEQSESEGEPVKPEGSSKAEDAPEEVKASGGGNGDDDNPPAPPEGTPPEDSDGEEKEPANSQQEHEDRSGTSNTEDLVRKEQIRSEEMVEQIKRVLPEVDKDDIEKVARDAILRLRSQETMTLPESFEDLVALVMRSQEEEWKTGHAYELVNKEGEVVKEHFIAWVRKRMMDVHDFNPTGEVNFFSDINVKVGYSVISFYDMIFTGSYFMEEDVVPPRFDESGAMISEPRVNLHKNPDYEKMREQLISEVFLFQNSRNNHVKYIHTMSQETELPKLINDIYYANPFMRGGYLEQVLTMPTMETDKKTSLGEEYISSNLSKPLEQMTDEEKVIELARLKEEFESGSIGHLLKENSDIGEGVRRALLAYYHITDYEMLEKILGKDAIFFQEEYMQKNPDTGEMELRKGHANVKDIDKFINYVNVFNDAHKDESAVDEVRERLRQTLSKELGLSKNEAIYAEAWAFSMTRWTGIGAKNDVGAVGFDAWSKVQNLLPYRLKQMDEKRKGVAGSIWNLLGIKRAGVSVMDGLTDVHDRSIIEAIQGGQGRDLEKANPFRKKLSSEQKDRLAQLNAKTELTEDEKSEKEKLEVKHLRFKQDMAQRFAANHVGNGFKIYDFLINHNEFNIEKMITYDEYGRPIIDQEAANKMIDGIQKAIRYGFCTWGGTDYSKTMRIWEQKEVPDLDENGKQKLDRNGNPATKAVPVMRDLPLGAVLFGPDVLRFIKEDIDRVESKTREEIESSGNNSWEIGEGDEKFSLDFDKMNSKTERDFLWKQILKYLIAEEIESHRNVNSELRRYNYSTIEKFYDFLNAKGTLNKDDIKDVRKFSKTTESRLIGEELPPSLLLGLLGGLWKEFKRQAPDLVK